MPQGGLCKKYEFMNEIEITILSIILMIGVGYVLKRIDFLSEKDITPLNKIVMNILLPCMIFSALYSSDLSLIPKLGILPFVILASSFVTGIVSFFISLVRIINSSN